MAGCLATAQGLHAPVAFQQIEHHARCLSTFGIGKSALAFHEHIGIGIGGIDKARNLFQAGDGEALLAALLGAKQFATAAQLQIFLRQQTTVLLAFHQFEAFLARFTQFVRAQQETGRFLTAPPHAATQLVQLGKAEAFGLFDHH